MRKTLLICVITIFALSACKKENTGEMNTPQMNDSQNIKALILGFKDKLDNHLKDGTTYAADSAVWYVEALLNYSYGYATALGCSFETNSVGTTVNTDGSNAYTLAQLNDVYEYLEEEATGNIPDDHYIFCIDVSLVVTGNQSTFSSATGYAKQLLPNYKSITDTSGYWYWGQYLGMCGSDSGLYVGTDAAEIIEALVNENVQHDYFIGLVSFNVFYSNGYVDPNFPFTDPYLKPYRSFCYQDTTGPNTDFCLSPSHISYYSGNSGAIYMLKDLQPPNKHFAYCGVTGVTWPSPDIDDHVIGFTYGTPISRP
jgi:hypothetical protein